ncbi:hypothetical protein [Singulisphaera sp. PoT]|uniref:hypothetical protein n=1 Tax=Singulisphaera sp. PoT TaxID=3411797 RepID=UPI003BF4E2E6
MSINDPESDWVRESLIDVRRVLEQRPQGRAIIGSSTIVGRVADDVEANFGPFKYLKIHPVTKYPPIDQTGAHVDAPEFDEDQVVYVLVIGSCTPRPGDMIVAHSISEGGRWVYYDACATIICVKFTQCGALVAGLQAFVGLYDAADPDKTIINDCFAMLGLVELTLDNPGSGYIDRVGYPLVFTNYSMSGPYQGPIGLFDVADGKVKNVRIVNPGVGMTKAPTVSLPSFAGPGTGAHITAKVAPTCCLGVRKLTTYGIVAQDSLRNFSVEGTVDPVDSDTVMVELDMPSFAKLRVDFITNGCSTLAGVFSVTLTGPGGYSQTLTPTLANPYSVTFSGIIPAGDFTLSYVIINGTPLPPQVVHIEHCDNLVVNVPLQGQMITNTVKVIACTSIAGPALPNATVTITNASGTPPYFATGTTDSNGFFTFTGAYNQCNYIFSVTPPPDCAGWVAPPSQTATPTAKLFLVDRLPGYGCLAVPRPVTIPPTVTISGPAGAFTATLTDPLTSVYDGILTLSANVTSCLPPSFGDSYAPANIDLQVGYSVGRVILFRFRSCGGPLFHVALVAGTPVDAVGSSGANVTAYCPLHDVMTITQADVDRVTNQLPISADLSQLVGTWTVVE